jgi:hypothetical protein
MEHTDSKKYHDCQISWNLNHPDRPVPRFQNLFNQNSYQKRRKIPLWYQASQFPESVCCDRDPGLKGFH